MSKRDYKLLLDDMLISSQRILDYTSERRQEDLYEDQMLFDAIVRNFEIIGEAANRIPTDYREAHPEIDWVRIRGFRNRIVHNYFGLDVEIIWKIVVHYLPVLIEHFKELLKN